MSSNEHYGLPGPFRALFLHLCLLLLDFLVYSTKPIFRILYMYIVLTFGLKRLRITLSDKSHAPVKFSRNLPSTPPHRVNFLVIQNTFSFCLDYFLRLAGKAIVSRS
jgi:hypothetical protein